MSHPTEPTAVTTGVRIHINRHDYEVAPGLHRVTELKRIAGIPPQDELEQVISGQFTPLPDDSAVTIVGAEHFVSHPRSGGSS